MTTLNVEGMMCEGCVKRVTEALRNLGLEPEVSLENKTVVFEGDEAAAAKAAEAIEDLGFEVVK
ncbi:MAG: heavy-metal-associated domain-containing protein [Lachnospiraceae bacterium]|nr:heavy-metal-associated domain-containing protein [Lachnospiraceae bacterium]